jgi:inorganic pyrophosphatase
MYNTYTSIHQLPHHVFDEMIHFFSVYKTLEGKTTAIDEAKDELAAIDIVREAIEAYKIKFASKKDSQ